MSFIRAWQHELVTYKIFSKCENYIWHLSTALGFKICLVILLQEFQIFLLLTVCFWHWIILSSAVFLNSGFEGTVLFKKFIQKPMHPLGTTGNPTWFLLYLSTEMVISLFHPEIWVMTIATYKIQVRLRFFHGNCWV